MPRSTYPGDDAVKASSGTMMRTPAARAGRICFACLLVSCGARRALQGDRADGGPSDTSRDTAAVVDVNTPHDLPLRIDGALNDADATDASATSDVSTETSPQVDTGIDGDTVDAPPPSCVTVGGLSF